MADIQIKDLNLVYAGGTHALSDFTLTVKDGEFLALLGPSGCGKSSVVRVLAGLEDGATGEVLFGNKPLSDLSPKEREVALIFPNSPLSPAASVEENLGFGLRQRKAPREVIDARVAEVAALFGLTEHLAKKPKQLTTLQRQRVALGRAVVREPKLYCFDEPLGGLDKALRAEMRTEIARLHVRLKKTFLYVTADRLEAMTMATRVAVLREGFLQQVDTPRNLYDYPVNLFVADMVGPLEFVRGVHLREEEGRFLLGSEEGTAALSPKVMERFSEFSAYANTERPLIAALRPEDGTPLGGCASERLLLFDGETELSVLRRDEGYEPHPEFGETDFTPPTHAEMKARVKSGKHHKK